MLNKQVLFFLFFFSTILSCEESSRHHELRPDVEIKIALIEKHINTIINYTLTKDQLIIGENCYMCVDQEESQERLPDHSIYIQDIPDSTFIEIDNKLTALMSLGSLEQLYFNECIIDGLEFELIAKHRQSKLNTFIQNYYHPSVAPIIEIVNSLAPEKHEIWYEKEELIKDFEDCEQNLFQEKIAEKCDTVYVVCDQMPKYKVGDQSVLDYSLNTIAPIIKKHNDLRGQLISKIKMDLIISDQGKVVFAEVTSAVDYELKKALRDQLMFMQDWTPGKIGNQEVCTKVTIPIACFKWE